jgi:hypothetical protein
MVDLPTVLRGQRDHAPERTPTHDLLPRPDRLLLGSRQLRGRGQDYSGTPSADLSLCRAARGCRKSAAALRLFAGIAETRPTPSGCLISCAPGTPTARIWPTVQTPLRLRLPTATRSRRSVRTPSPPASPARKIDAIMVRAEPGVPRHQPDITEAEVTRPRSGGHRRLAQIHRRRRARSDGRDARGQRAKLQAARDWVVEAGSAKPPRLPLLDRPASWPAAVGRVGGR